jgi:DNA-binding NtrC family response regulator
VEDWLVAAGFEVLGFGDPRDALQAAAFTRLDAVLSRDHMPDMDGMALHRALSEANPDLAARFILMTGGWIDPDIHAFARERRVRLLHLPFQEDELLRLVSEALSGKP